MTRAFTLVASCRRGDLYHNPTPVSDQPAGTLPRRVCFPVADGRAALSSRSPTVTLTSTPPEWRRDVTDHYPPSATGTTRAVPCGRRTPVGGNTRRSPEGPGLEQRPAASRRPRPRARLSAPHVGHRAVRRVRQDRHFEDGLHGTRLRGIGRGSRTSTSRTTGCRGTALREHPSTARIGAFPESAIRPSRGPEGAWTAG